MKKVSVRLMAVSGMSLWAGGVVMCLAVQASAQTPTLASEHRFPVTGAMVAFALADRQIPVDGIEVRIAAPITSAAAIPVLEVQSVAVNTPQSARIRLACRNRRECMPFYATVIWPEKTDAKRIAHELNRLQNENSVNGAAPAKRVLPAAAETAEMPIGTPAVLLIEDARVHVTLRVISLESGSTGDLIHVATPDHKQRFVAAVVNSGFLRGQF